jgi:hypothetical protein
MMQRMVVLCQLTAMRPLTNVLLVPVLPVVQQ